MPGQSELELSGITPSKDPEIVKGWNDNPLLLVNQLCVALNQVTSCLEPDETDVNRRAKLKDGVNWQTRSVLLCGVYPLQLARQIKLLKTLHETLPFDESILREVSEATQPFDSPRFAKAIIKWKVGLEQLADWADLQNRLQPQTNDEHGGKDKVEHSVVPIWNSDERVLMFRGQTVRKFSPSTGKNVLDILASFNECQWPTRIDDPLCRTDPEKTKQALRTINKSLSVLKFSKDGDGIKWAAPKVLPNSP